MLRLLFLAVRFDQRAIRWDHRLLSRLFTLLVLGTFSIGYNTGILVHFRSLQVEFGEALLYTSKFQGSEINLVGFEAYLIWVAS